MKPISEAEIKAGQAVYSPLLLKIYNLWVVDFSNAFIWRCPKRHQIKLFQENVSNNHLDIGVGTGYYLNQCNWADDAQISLMDLNPNCLNAAKSKLSKYNPVCYKADIYKPQQQLANRFDSISMNFLLHCLPGDMETKSIAIKHAVAMLAPNGVLFGATILADDNLHNFISRQLNQFYNYKKIYTNSSDDKKTLQRILNKHLTDVEFRLIGCVALFKGIKPENKA